MATVGTPGTEGVFAALRARDRSRFTDLAASLDAWPGPVLASHRSAAQLYHALEFLADVGFRADDPSWPSLRGLLERVLADPSPEGALRLHGAGGDGAPGGWALCDAPILLYCAAALGLDGDPRVRRSADHLRGLVRDNGWPCVAVLPTGTWRGPGRKEDPCPYATLAMLKALSAFDDLRASPEAWTGADALLGLWESSRERHPYMFFMGTDFRKLRLPFVWYDLLHVAEVLSRLPQARRDPRFRAMLGAVRAQAGPDGRYAPGAAYVAWKDWDFGVRSAPSAWLDAFVARLLERAEAAA